jgi:hypothetical protein
LDLWTQDGSKTKVSKNFLKAVDQSIRDVREAAYEVLAKIQAKRIKKNLNDYQVGDFVLVYAKGMNWKKNKLAPNYFGPFRVEEVYKSDVSVRHIVTEDRRVIHMNHLKPFFSDSYEEAYWSALIDYSQHVIDRIVDWAGDPETRSGCHF